MLGSGAAEPACRWLLMTADVTSWQVELHSTRILFFHSLFSRGGSFVLSEVKYPLLHESLRIHHLPGISCLHGNSGRLRKPEEKWCRENKILTQMLSSRRFCWANWGDSREIIEETRFFCPRWFSPDPSLGTHPHAGSCRAAWFKLFQ